MTEPRPSVEFVKDDPPPPPPAAYPPPPPVAVTSRPNLGTGIGVVGLGAALIGVFGLPVEDVARGQSFTYGSFHEVATEFTGPGSEIFFGGIAQFWWHVGLLMATSVLVLLLAALTVRPNAVLGWTLAVLAAAVGVVHAVSLGQTSDYIAVQQFFKAGPSVYKYAGLGIWVGLAGLAVLSAGGLVTALTRRRRPGVPPPIR